MTHYHGVSVESEIPRDSGRDSVTIALNGELLRRSMARRGRQQQAPPHFPSPIPSYIRSRPKDGTELERGFGIRLPVSIFVSSGKTVLDDEENGEGGGGWGCPAALCSSSNALH